MIALCPPRPSLTAFLSEGCEAASDLSDHLDSCSDCQAELDRIADDSLLAFGPSDNTWLNDDVAPTLRRMMDSLIQELPDGTIDYAPQLDPVSDRPDLVGRFDRFDIVQELGRGGMGVVYEAFDPELRRTVALKVLRPELAHQEKARTRILREARATADVRHDHILSPHSIEEHDGVPYLVFPLVRGRNLQQRIDSDGPLPITAALRIAAEIADALAAAHAKGLIHRDLKPSNVLLEGPVERVKLVDFGLVRVDDEFDLSHDGALCGTPRCMAPEQAQGLPCSPTTDLFGLGSILHVMLAGRPPFDAASTYGILRSVVEDQAPPLAKVPTSVSNLLKRLHAKEPTARPASAANVAAELRTLALVSTVHRKRPTRVFVALSILAFAALFAAGSQLLQPGAGLEVKAPVIPAQVVPSGTPTLFVGHTGTASRLAITPDGRHAISVSGFHGDGTIRLWDFASGKELRQFKLDGPMPPTDIPSSPGEESSQWCALAISNDGKLVATSSSGGLTVVWDFATGQEKYRLILPTKGKQLAFSPDDTILLTGCLDGMLYLHDAATGKLRKKWLAHTQQIRVIGFLPDGERILTGGYDKLVKCWDVKTGEELYRCGGHGTRVQGLAISSDGKWFLSGADDIRKWDAKTGKLLKNFVAPFMWGITSVELSPDNSKLASVAYDGTLRIWDVATGRELFRFGGQVGWLWNVAFAPDGQNVLCTSGGHSGDMKARYNVLDYALRRWKIPSGVTAPLTFVDGSGEISSLSVTPGGDSVLSVGGSNVILWNLANGKPQRLFKTDSQAARPTSAATSPDGRLAVTAMSDGIAVIWDAASGQELRRLRRHRGGMAAALFTPDSKRVITAGGDDAIRIWDAATARTIDTLATGFTGVCDIALSKDGNRLLSLAEDGTLTVWDLTTNKQTVEWKAPGKVRNIALAPDGKWVASVDGKLSIWDTDTGKLVKTLEHDGKDASTVVISPDGKQIVSGGLDGRIYLWDRETSDLIGTFAGHDGPVRTLTISPTGRYLISAGGRDAGDDATKDPSTFTIRRWDLSPLRGSDID